MIINFQRIPEFVNIELNETIERIIKYPYSSKIISVSQIEGDGSLNFETEILFSFHSNSNNFLESIILLENRREYPAEVIYIEQNNEKIFFEDKKNFTEKLKEIISDKELKKETKALIKLGFNHSEYVKKVQNSFQKIKEKYEGKLNIKKIDLKFKNFLPEITVTPFKNTVGFFEIWKKIFIKYFYFLKMPENFVLLIDNNFLANEINENISIILKEKFHIENLDFKKYFNKGKNIHTFLKPEYNNETLETFLFLWTIKNEEKYTFRKVDETVRYYLNEFMRYYSENQFKNVEFKVCKVEDIQKNINEFKGIPQ
jgi:hypothetical protein